MKTASRFFIVVGFLLLMFGVYLVWQRNNPTRLSFYKYNPPTNNLLESKMRPIKFDLERLHISLPVIKASFAGGNSWETTTDGVSYITNSPVPGERGNSILYGHNWASLLGPLVKSKPGDKIVITYSDNSEKTFIIEYTQIVTPDEIHILSQTDDKRLTVYTCTGFLDTKRFVAVAIPV